MIPTEREPTHPGEILLEEFLRPLDLTQTSVAEFMQIPLNRLNEIIHGKRGVSADTAIRLARVFGTSPQFWLNLQTNWDLYHATREIGRALEDLPVHLPPVVLPVFRLPERRAPIDESAEPTKTEAKPKLDTARVRMPRGGRRKVR